MKIRLTIRPDDFTRGEVLPGGLVADFGELADQLFEHQPICVADGLGVQVDLGELFGDHLVEQAGLGQPLDLGVEFKCSNSHARRARTLHVAEQVLRNVVPVAEQGSFSGPAGGVVEALARPCAAGTGSGLTPCFLCRPARPAPRPLVDSSTQSRRRSTVKGRMTLP